MAARRRARRTAKRRQAASIIVTPEAALRLRRDITPRHQAQAPTPGSSSRYGGGCRGGWCSVRQARNPASIPRTTATRRRIMRAHAARVRADHERLTSLRARVFPESVMTGRPFDEGAARREAKRLMAVYRAQARRVRRAR